MFSDRLSRLREGHVHTTGHPDCLDLSGGQSPNGTTRADNKWTHAFVLHLSTQHRKQAASTEIHPHRHFTHAHRPRVGQDIVQVFPQQYIIWLGWINEAQWKGKSPLLHPSLHLSHIPSSSTSSFKTHFTLQLCEFIPCPLHASFPSTYCRNLLFFVEN